ncbi:MAG: choice-of-anchor tandem repeat NxxGxxAF-containing protein, partial [Planctomycetota bacterium]
AAGIGVLYDRITLHDLSDSGESFFAAELTGFGINDNNGSGVFRYRDGVTEVVARQGDAAPGVGPGVAFGQLGLGTFEGPSIEINGSGEVLIRTGLQGLGVDNSNDGAVFASDENGDLELILREGDQVPGLEDGVVFTNVDTVDGLGMNESGDLLINAKLIGPGISGANDFALFYVDGKGDGELQMIVREGDTIDVNNSPLVEDLRTVESYDLSYIGTLSAFNDRSEIAFRVTFTDTSEGIFLASVVPEPGAAALALLPLIVAVSRQH